MKVSVIICAYTEKRWDELVAAVKSIKEQSLSPYEIIVAIDHNEQLLQRVNESISDIITTANKEDRGLSGARNSAITIVKGDVVAFMDEDAEADSKWLELLAATYEDPAVWGAGGAIEPVWLAGKPRWFPEEFNWVVGCTYTGMPTTTAPIRNLIGCNMSFRRDIFMAIGGFLSEMGRIGTIPLGCEETEFCIRALQHDPQRLFIYEPQARVYHRVPASRSNWHYFRSRCYSEGLSKAQVAQFVGAGDGLASERTYTFRTLPMGFFRSLGNALCGDIGGLGRAGAIVVGLLWTTRGYLRGRISQKSATTHREQDEGN